MNAEVACASTRVLQVLNWGNDATARPRPALGRPRVFGGSSSGRASVHVSVSAWVTALIAASPRGVNRAERRSRNLRLAMSPTARLGLMVGASTHEGRTMTIAFPGESADYRAARDRLLEQEIELRRATEAVAASRRALPPGGPLPDDYVFEGAGVDGAPTNVKLSELFEPNKNSLVIYNFMFPRDPGDTSPGPTFGKTALLPLEEGPCPSCTALLDQLNAGRIGPVVSAVVYGTARCLQPSRDVSKWLLGPVKAHDVPTEDIAEGPQRSKLHQDGSVRMQSKRHTGLEEHVRPRLRSQVALVVRIGCLNVFVAQLRLVIGGQKHNHRGGVLEGSFEHLSDVRSRLFGVGDELPPLAGFKAEGAAEVEHRTSRCSISAVNDHDSATVDARGRGSSLGASSGRAYDQVIRHVERPRSSAPLVPGAAENREGRGAVLRLDLRDQRI